jgi:hypothetical protein
MRGNNFFMAEHAIQPCLPASGTIPDTKIKYETPGLAQEKRAFRFLAGSGPLRGNGRSLRSFRG